MYRLLVLLLLSGCAPYALVGVGYDVNSNTYTDGAVAEFELGATKGPLGCALRHTSYVTHGRPFNDDWETATNRIFCRVKIE